SCHAWSDFFEQFEPFCAHAVFKGGKAGRVAARPRQSLDEAVTDRIGDLRENDRHAASRLLQCPYNRTASGQDDVRRECDQPRRVLPKQFNIACAPTSVDPNVAAIRPSQLLQSTHKRRQADRRFRVVPGQVHEHADAAHPLALLRARRERPSGCAAEQRYETAPLHSITSSAATSSVCGTVNPSDLAVLTLMASSNLVGCSTGRSLGCAPLRILPA